MKISDVWICWTPDSEQYPVGMRGKVRIFRSTAGHDEIAPFPCRAGRCEPLAHDPRLEVRQAYALRVAFVMSERDGLDVLEIHQLMLQIDEYASASAGLLAEGAHT